VRSYLEHLANERRLSRLTVANYARDIASLLALAGGVPLRRMDAQQIRRHVAQLHARGLDGRTLARMLSAWRGFLGFYNSDNLTYAASIAYYALLSLVPMMILSVIALSHVIDQPELLTIIIENLVGKYLIGKAFGAITAAERERAEAAAREEVRQTIAQYCAGQPNNGAGIKICTNPTQ